MNLPIFNISNSFCCKKTRKLLNGMIDKGFVKVLKVNGKNSYKLQTENVIICDETNPRETINDTINDTDYHDFKKFVLAEISEIKGNMISKQVVTGYNMSDTNEKDYTII